MVKKLISEFVGTFLLVMFGCGTAVACNTYVTNVFGTAFPFTMLIIALAFGLILTALVSTIGKVSGAHVNPAVSLAMWIDGRINIFELIEYVCVQVMGGLLGAFTLSKIFGSADNVAANGFEKLSLLPVTTTMPVALVVELILTFVFVLVVLSATDKKKNDNPSIVIGLTLTLVHIFGIPFTGTSVNPARSIGPALVQGGDAASQMWVFIVAPLVGGLLAALFYKFIIKEKEVVETIAEPVAVEEKEESKKVEPKVLTKKVIKKK